MVGGEGLGCGAAGYRVQHRGFHLDVAAGVEEFAEGAQDLGSLDEHRSDVDRGVMVFFVGSSGFRDGAGAGGYVRGRGRFGFGQAAGVHDEVYVALAVAKFHVLEAVIFVGQGEHGLGKKAQCGLRLTFFIGLRRGLEGELAGAGAHQVAANADVVAQVEQFVEREDRFADVVLADVDLEASAAPLQVREAGLALNAETHKPAGYGDLRLFGFELPGGDRSGGVIVALNQLRDGAELHGFVCCGEAIGVDGLGGGEAQLNPEGADGLQLFLALGVELFFELAFKLGQGSLAGWDAGSRRGICPRGT